MPEQPRGASHMKSPFQFASLLATILLISGCGRSPPGPASDPASAGADPSPAASVILRSEYHTFALVQVAGPLEHPWSVAFLPDGRYLVSERPGRLNLVSPGGEVTPLRGVPDVLARNQGGLMEVSLHPEFADNNWVYFTYSRGNWRNNQTSLVMARGTLDGTRLRNVEQLFRQDLGHWPGIHYGGRIAWLPDGTLLLSVGDRGGQAEFAQDPAHHAGSLLHLDERGRPASATPRFAAEGALPELYSIGHRNIQGLVVDAANDRIWATEHGPRGGDELNLIVAGGNYGWPVVTLGRDYRTEAALGEARSRRGMIDPVYEIAPTHAPSGLALVKQPRFARWQGNLLAGGLRARSIRRLVIENDVVVHDEELLRDQVGRIRDVREGPDGHIYILTDEAEGGLYRLDVAD